MDFPKWARRLLGRHEPCPWCRVRLQLTGAPPANDSERLILEIVGSGKSASYHWLESHLMQALYRAELERGGPVDIGIWGLSLFAREAGKAIAAVRPDFGYLVPDPKEPDESAGLK